MSHEEIIAAFKDNDKFFTYDYVYPIAHQEKYSDGIEFLDIIKIVCKENNYFEIELYFPHVRTQEERNNKKASYCYIFHYRDGLQKSRLPKPQKEIFERDYKITWEKNSAEEKLLIAMSYFIGMDHNLLPAKYDCSLMLNNTIADPAAILKKNYSITSKDELLDYIKHHKEKSVTPFFESLKQVIDENPEKTIMEIAAEKEYTIPQISRMYFVESMRNHVDSNDILLYTDSADILLLRLGFGAGYISREESIELGMPIANQFLKRYTSFQDFAAHMAASESFIGVTCSAFAKYPAEVIKYYNDAPKYFNLEEILFDSTEAYKPLLFDDVYYKPVGEALWWCKVQNEYENKNGKELPAVKYAISRFGNLPCLEKLLKQIKPVKYDSSKNQDTIAFYNKNYKQIWENIPENEKYAIAFSSNLFELNRQYHMDFDAKVMLSDNSSDPKELLKDSWSIESYEGLIENFNSLEEYGHSGAYKALCELLDKYPDKSPLQIASQENLSIIDTTRLHFVKDTREILGVHGIEAWDEGRQITTLRWGIAAGYISSEEAMILIEPLIKRIRQNYDSFEDYISHYIMGRQFYALYDGNYEKLGEKAKAAYLSARAYIPFEFLSFTCENSDDLVSMELSESLFTPSEDFLKWNKVMTLYSQNASPETIEQLMKLENEMPECRNLVFYWHISLLNHFRKYKELIKFTEENMAYLETLPKDSEVYANSMYFYIQALNYLFNPLKALSVYDAQPEGLKGNVYYYEQFAYANYLLINFSTSQKEMDYYRQKASASYKLLQDYDYNIGRFQQSWLQFVEGKGGEEVPPLEGISEDSADYSSRMLAYLDNLLSLNLPDKAIALYQSLPQNLQTNEKFYYNYGLANYFMSYRCVTIIEKDIYNSRAADIFNRLQAHGFLLDDSINHWLEAVRN